MYKRTASGKHRNLMTTHKHAPQFKGVEIHINNGSRFPVIKVKKKKIKNKKVNRFLQEIRKSLPSGKEIMKQHKEFTVLSKERYNQEIKELGRPSVEEMKKLSK